MLFEELSSGKMVCPCVDTLGKEIQSLAQKMRNGKKREIDNTQPGTRCLSADGWTAR